ncbi:hypothetical protein K490DRAFT_53792 [Saccharata proteae CBS 121410]|uniref:Uncharacterized protein n=1 Tax=Saccharata proteae CBS 121410 TaxID=1314787 RepID=A0A9P4I154_9PEZI|nr:hypothetical protein K490DRAFT_53792 [Saccharata proteae CBS 121410]
MAMNGKRKASSSPPMDESPRTVRPRTDSDSPYPDVIVWPRPDYPVDEDPFHPANCAPFRVKSDLDLRLSTVLREPATEPVFRKATQDMLNHWISNPTLNRVYQSEVFELLAAAGGTAVKLDEVDIVLSEELGYKLAWLLGERAESHEMLHQFISAMKKGAKCYNGMDLDGDLQGQPDEGAVSGRAMSQDESSPFDTEDDAENDTEEDIEEDTGDHTEHVITPASPEPVATVIKKERAQSSSCLAAPTPNEESKSSQTSEVKQDATGDTANNTSVRQEAKDKEIAPRSHVSQTSSSESEEADPRLGSQIPDSSTIPSANADGTSNSRHLTERKGGSGNEDTQNGQTALTGTDMFSHVVGTMDRALNFLEPLIRSQFPTAYLLGYEKGEGWRADRIIPALRQRWIGPPPSKCKSRSLEKAFGTLKTKMARSRKGDHGESCLVPWVFANPSIFPELVECPFFILGFDKDKTPCIDWLLSGNMLTYDNRKDVIDHTIMVNLQKREEKQKLYPSRIEDGNYDLQCGSLARDLKMRAGTIDGVPVWTEQNAKISMEQVLRPFIFVNRTHFPELAQTEMARSWLGGPGHSATWVLKAEVISATTRCTRLRDIISAGRGSSPGSEASRSF